MARGGGKPQPTITDDRALGAADIQRSLRFNRSDDPQLQRTATTTSNTFTYSTWVKRSTLSTFQYLLSIGGQGLLFNTDDTIRVYTDSGANASTAKFRDVTSWYHVVLSMNSGSATVYVNNVTHLSSVSGFSLSTSTNYLKVGWLLGDPGQFNLDGYLAETQLIDGSALTPSSFGFTDSQTGMWMPKRYEGSYGTSGFRLDYSDNSSTSALGIDKSPNGNDFTVNNFSVSSGDGNDSRTDTPTLRKATLNSITGWTYNATLKNGALEMTGSAGFKEISTIAVDGTSKFYYELVRTNAAGWQLVGIFIGQPNNPSNALTNSAIWGFASTQAQYFGGTYTSTSNVPSWAVDNVMGIKYENGTLKLYKDGTLATSNATGIPTSDIIFAYIANDNTNAASFVRFDSDSWTQATAAGVDSTWELSGKNLPPNVPSIRPQKHFDTILYTGNGTSGHSISGLEFKPDFVWIKNRDGTYYHNLSDTVRGITRSVNSNANDAEVNYSNISAVHDHGFVVGASELVNKNSQNLVAWCWKAGGAAVANSDGDTASQVSVNTEAGFSIVTYTGTGSSTTIGHGLGKKPEMIFMKSRSATGDWAVLDEANSTAEYTFYLNDNNAYGSSSGYTFYADTPPTSSVWTVNSASATNANGVTYVAYCWTSIPGYSKIGKYSGNSSSDGAYVHLGFRPAWVLFKRNDYGGNWFIVDNKRDVDNECTRDLYPNTNGTETDNTNFVDFLSDGFKLRTTGTAVNAGTIVYMAFAEQSGETPFETFANAR